MSRVEKAKEIGNLLASSPMNQNLKETVLNNIYHMPEEAMDVLIDALKSEASFLSKLDRSLISYGQWRKDLWQTLKVDQQKAINDITNEEIQEMSRQQEVDENKLNN